MLLNNQRVIDTYSAAVVYIDQIKRDDIVLKNDAQLLQGECSSFRSLLDFPGF